MYLPLIVGALYLSLFCYALRCVHSSFAIILKRKRKLVALLDRLKMEDFAFKHGYVTVIGNVDFFGLCIILRQTNSIY